MSHSQALLAFCSVHAGIDLAEIEIFNTHDKIMIVIWADMERQTSSNQILWC